MNFLTRKHWFFDFDGTLADTDADIRLAWRQTIHDLGLSYPDFETRFRNGPPIDAMVDLLFPEHSSDALKAAVRERFKVNYDESGFPSTHPYPRMGDLLLQLKAQGAHVYIASNKRVRALSLLAQKLGWLPLLSGIYAPDCFKGVRLAKPDFLARALALHQISPAQAIMVGDSAGDIDAGHVNGLLTIGCAWGYAPRAALASADVIFDSPELFVDTVLHHNV